MSDPFQHVEPFKYLCDNPKCRHHVAVYKSKAGWCYTYGFRQDVDKELFSKFDEGRDVNYCPSCHEAFTTINDLTAQLAQVRAERDEAKRESQKFEDNWNLTFGMLQQSRETVTALAADRDALRKEVEEARELTNIAKADALRFLRDKHALQTELAALRTAQQDAREDGELLTWVMRNISGKALREAGIITSGSSDYRAAIRAARGG
jgi:chromosome segregation ATPase